MAKASASALTAKAKKIKLLIFDVDGVLTDGRIILDNDGNEFKAFHVRDGHGIRMFIKAGFKVALITGRESKVVARRAQELGIADVFQKSHRKTDAYRQVIKKFGVSDEEVAYVGDDVVDLPLFVRVGLPVAVADACSEAQKAAVYVTKAAGGRGAAREVCELILKAHGKWKELVNEYCAQV
jgi:3-deoxy-D-manno-octulosonate 8-phosphate phosphatase (KDO 8-P phosphatase)